jgi:hypothetical protein
VFRVLVAVSSAIALQLGAIGAPLVHAHLDGLDHAHHRAVRVHAHLGGHAAPHDVRDHHDHPAFDEDESAERANRLQLFVAVEPAPLATPSLPPARYAPPAPLESIMRRPPAVAHSHDPPGVRLAVPRAPPSFPS